MKTASLRIPYAHQQLLEEMPGPNRVQVTLLDRDNQPLACGVAVLPLLLGVGIFWPACPMPCRRRLAAAKCFILPSGEMMKLKALNRCAGSPAHYDYWVSRP